MKMINPVAAVRAAALLSVAYCLADSAHAGEFDEADFTLRFPAALSRFSPYADVAAVGGASVGSPWPSSGNPAAIAWRREDASFRISPQFSDVSFDEGTSFRVFTESLSVDADSFGRFLLTAAQVRSNREATRDGLVYDFELDLGQIAWSLRPAAQWSVGASFRYSRSSSDFDLDSLRASATDDQTYLGAIGVMHAPRENLLVGAMVEYGVTHARTTSFDVFGLGIGDIASDDTIDQVVVRIGTSYEYMPRSTAYLDYHFGRFDGGAGELTIHRFLLGFEQRIVDWLFVRGGMSADSRGNVSPTAGIGVYPLPSLSIDLAYQDDYFPEVEREFGSARTLSLSLSLSL